MTSTRGVGQDIGEYNKQEIKELTQQVEDQIRFLEYFLNTVGSNETSARDKDVIIRESYKKIFRDNLVQVEDDLLLDRKVITNKNISAYLKDVEFFFKDATFQFKIKEIKPKLTDNGDLFFEISLDRTLTAVGINNEAISNTKQRFIEVNLDRDSKELKIASMYTTKLSRDEELLEWWATLSFEWENIFREKFQIEEDSVTVDDLYRISSMDTLDLSGNQLIIDLNPIQALTDLKYVDISNTNIQELNPISNVTFLSYLDISNTPTKDIQFIKYSERLVHLNLSNTGVHEIDDLLNLKNLKHLKLAKTPLRGFGVLNNFKNLETLDLEESGFNNIENIRELTNLKILNLKGNFLINFGFLSELVSLEEVNLEGTNILDLAPLAELKNLWRLNINSTEVSQLNPLSGSTNLRRIYADRTSITEELADGFSRTNRRILLIHNVENLQTWWETLPEGWNTVLSKIYPKVDFKKPSIEELSELVGIDSLNLSGSEVVSLRPALKFKKAIYLAIENTAVQDLSPLVEMKTLLTIKASNTKISNLQALAELTGLEYLYLKNSNISSIDPIKPLVRLKHLDVDETEVAAWDVMELTRILPQTTIIFRSQELATWWGGLDGVWQGLFNTQFELSSKPSTEELHRMTSHHDVTIVNVDILNLESLLIFFNLRKLLVENVPLQDISAISRMENLEKLKLSQAPIRDLMPLSNLSYLESLDLSNTGVEELRPLSELNRLKVLNLSGTNVVRLRGLETLFDLRELDIASTNVKNIKQITHLVNLEKLICFNTRIGRRSVENFKKANPSCDVRFY